MIGFAKLVIGEAGRHACIVNILSMLRDRDKGPTDALITQSVRSCADRGIPYLVYEHFSYGRKAPDGLQHFKAANGFVRVDVPRYYIPLTPLGKVALRLGLHRGLSQYVPEAIAAKLRNLRADWYSRKAQTTAAI
jgi:hypothetical protein